MSKRSIVMFGAFAIAAGSAGVSWLAATASEPAPAAAVQPDKPAKPDRKWVPAVQAKPLSDNVRKGLAWLAGAQHADGGWSQGEHDRTQRAGEDIGKPNVGDTAAAVLALLRSGSTPGEGEHATVIRRGVEYILTQVEAADDQSLWVTDNRGTRLQGKLGQYIDTFLASLVLTEVKDKMPDEKATQRVAAALAKVVKKIEKNQRADGTWNDQGWATALQQGLAAKALNRAAQSGVKVDEDVRKKAEDFARANYDKDAGAFKARGAAGVDLYAGASTVGAVQDSATTNEMRRDRLEAEVASAPEPVAQAAQAELSRIQQTEQDLKEQKRALIDRLDDERFIAGFGSNGGEEFLSYMTIGEALVVDGGAEWEKWDRKVTENLNRVQNADGSWSGHHCITGKTFCTSAALLTLMTDRAMVPLAGELRRR